MDEMHSTSGMGVVEPFNYDGDSCGSIDDTNQHDEECPDVPVESDADNEEIDQDDEQDEEDDQGVPSKTGFAVKEVSNIVPKHDKHIQDLEEHESGLCYKENLEAKK